MGQRGQFIISCFVFSIAFIAPDTLAAEDDLTPEDVVGYIRNHKNIHLVIAAIRTNSSLYANYLVSKHDNTTMLIHASKYGEDKVVSELIKGGAKVDSVTSDGYTALISAIKRHDDSSRNYKYHHIVSLLLSANASVETPEAPLWGPVHWAAHYGANTMLKSLLKKNPDVNREDNKGRTPLVIGAEYGKFVLQQLIDAGADLDHQDFDGETALMKCIRRRSYYFSTIDSHGYLCDILLRAGANTELPEAPTWGPLHHAAHLGSQYLTERLVKVNAKVNRTDSKGNTPLLVAAENRKDVLEILLEGKSDVNHQAYNGETALVKNVKEYNSYYKDQWNRNHEIIMRYNPNIELPDPPVWGAVHWAAYKDAQYILKSLIAANTNIERVDSEGRTPLIVAAEEGNRAMKMLLKAGAKVNHQDNTEDTAMTKLIKNSYSGDQSLPSNLFASLMEAGADVELPKAPALGPLHLASEDGFRYMVESLVAAGADVNRVDASGRTPMIMAAEEMEDVMKPLIDAGAKVDAQDNEGNTALSKSLDDGYWHSWYAYSCDSCISNLQDLLNASASVDLPVKPARSPLHLAAEHGSWFAVRSLIAAGADVNRTDSKGVTPLMVAAEEGEWVVRDLVDSYSDINHMDYEDETALIKACRHERDTTLSVIVDTLLEGGAHVNRDSSTKKTALHYTAQKGEIYATRRLLENGASVTATDTQGYTPLLSAAGSTSSVRMSMLELLIAGKSDVKHESNRDGTILHRLVVYNDAKSIKFVMRFCPDLKGTNEKGETAIALATSYNRQDVLEALRDEYISSCVHDWKVYNKGERRCDVTKAYECTDDCSWREINRATAGCDEEKRRRRRDTGILSFAPSTTSTITTRMTTPQTTSPCPLTCHSSDGEHVCGSDGITYGSQCELRMKNCGNPSVTVVHSGSCPAIGHGCSFVCTEEYAPVCGSDGQTYDNLCYLESVRDCNFPSLTVITPGPCPSSWTTPLIPTTIPETTRDYCDPLTCSMVEAPVCGSNEVTYPNDCHLTAAACKDPSIRKVKDGKCESKNPSGGIKQVIVNVNFS